MSRPGYLQYLRTISGARAIGVKKYDFYFIYVALAILFQSLNGVLGKYVANSLSGFVVTDVFFNIFYILSIACLAMQALVWQQALKHYNISFAYPFMSIVNFVVLLFSFLLFNEGITAANVLGLAVISCGIYILTKGGDSA